MIVSAYEFRKNPQIAIQLMNEVLAGSSTGCIEIRRSRSFLSDFVLNIATTLQRYLTGRCANCGAKKITASKYFFICPYCELVPPRSKC